MTYLDELHANQRADDLRPSNAYQPLPEQIVNWWQDVPPALRHREFQIKEIAAQLRGKYRSKPAERDLGNALRKLSWSYRRDYKGTATGHRLWQPPENWL